jgi:2-keto-4-pentenoate hydratase
MALEHSSPSERQSIADELVRAHLSGRGVVSTSLPVPLSPASAMQVQALVQERLARPVGGWKVAIGPQQLPVAAPLLDLYPDSSEIPLFRNCTIEVELAVHLRKDLPRRETGAYERSDILDAIENVVLGIEVIGGRFDGTANVPFLSFLADNLGNKAYVVGGSVPLSALGEVNGLDCHVTLNGQPLYQAPASHPAGDPLLPLLAYANAQSDHLGGLKAGQVVTTGSLCGVLPVRVAGLLEARISQLGRISVRLSD